MRFKVLFIKYFLGTAERYETNEFGYYRLCKAIYGQIRLQFFFVLAKTLNELPGRRIQVLLCDCVFQPHHDHLLVRRTQY